MNMIDKAIVSFRIGPQRWLDNSRFSELLDLFGAYPNVADELTFFSQDTHSPLPLDHITKRASILSERMSTVREMGYRTGINHLSTLGHLNENLPNSLSDKYGRIVGIDGTVAQGSLCPNDESVRDYISQIYRVLALANPDYIWMDDDLRLANHYPVMVGCFCDNCLSIFSKESAADYTRESLQNAFNGNSTNSKLDIRKAWVEHHKSTMKRVFELIEKSIHAANRCIAIGVMTTELLYDGYNYAQNSNILSGPNNTDVMWRPGEGFYFDDRPSGVLAKAHSLGRQVSMIPDNVVSIQAEIENFPYQPLKKSKQMNALEGAAYIASGCTGAAFNVLPMCDESLGNYSPLISKLADTRPFYDMLVQHLKRSKPSGVYTGWCQNSIIAGNLSDGDWLSSDIRGNIFSHSEEILDLGIPAAYSLNEADVTLLSGNSVAAMDEADILRILSSGVYMDAQALETLNQMGYGELTGFVTEQTIEHDSLEMCTNHQLNAGFEGDRRDARQSFAWWGVAVTRLVPAKDSCETLAQLVDYTGTVLAPCCIGVFENRLGGRVCAAGYYPWTFLQSFSKSAQIKCIMRWLSKDRLQAYVDSFHKVTLWYRNTGSGTAVVTVINSSLDTAHDMAIMLKTSCKQIRVFDMDCTETIVVSSGKIGAYKKFILPAINPWEIRMIQIDPPASIGKAEG